jgi:translation initiation factor 4B
LKPSPINSFLAKEPQHPARDFSDWTRKGPLPDIPSNQRRVSDRPNHGRNFDTLSDAGSERTSGRRFESDGKVRDLGNWERKGPLSPVAPGGREGGRPRSNEGPQLRRNSPAWGEGRSQDGSRPPRREFHERPERTPTAPELDNQWRARMRPDPPIAKEPSNPPSPIAPPAPAIRPKLNLQKRTVPESESASAARPADSKSNPFGAARPIDTAAREREVEERRVRQRKEAEEKAKVEKAEKAEKAEKQRLAKEQAKSEKAAAADANGSKESGAETPPVNKNFEILRRAGDDEIGDQEVTKPTKEATASQNTPAPKEKASVLPPSKANGNWRTPTTPSTEAPPPDEDGWSTVGTKQRGNRRGQAGRGFA